MPQVPPEINEDDIEITVVFDATSPINPELDLHDALYGMNPIEDWFARRGF
jgi:hypothetical protein